MPKAAKPATAHANPVVAPSAPRRSADELAHELQVHRIELEMQNEELRRTQLDLAAARDRFVDLYDFAPVGYLTLDPEGRVIAANLVCATMLGEGRQALLGQRFVHFVELPDRDRWQRHLHDALQHDGTRRLELALKPSAGRAGFHAQLDGLRVSAPGAEPTLRVTLTDVTQRQQAELDQRIAAQAVEAREAERRRVARELHEDLGQRLSSLKMELAARPPGTALAAAADQMAAILDTLDDALATVRRIASDLRPLVLDDLGLNAAIDWLARDWARRAGVQITLLLDDDDPPLRESTLIALYRMVQEALAHMARYAPGCDLHLALQQFPGELLLAVKAAGSASAPGAVNLPAQAPTALHQQARLLGGRLELEDTRDGGRRITVRLPLRRAADAAGPFASKDPR